MATDILSKDIIDAAEIQEKLATTIRSNFTQQIGFLNKLVSFESTRGHESECQNWLASEFEIRNWSVDQFTIGEVGVSDLPGVGAIVDVDYDEAVQCVATVQADAPKGCGRSLILQGHIDVVPTGAPELWSQDPFSAHIKEGKMHGRGAADMKAGVSAIVFALDALDRLGYAPAGCVFVETVTDEECTGNGALATLKRGYVADACLIPEPTGNKLVRAELGSVWFKIRILGRPGHVQAADHSANAIMSAQEYIADLIKLTEDINEEAASHPYFGVIDDPVKFSLGKIRGGDWLGSVPSWCEIECRLSVLPGHPNVDVQKRIRTCVAGTAERLNNKVPEVTWIGFKAEGHVFKSGSDAESELEACHRAIFGEQLDDLIMTATSDTRNYDLYYDIPTLCYGCAGDGFHSPNEAVDLASLEKTTNVLALFIARWCGLKQKQNSV